MKRSIYPGIDDTYEPKAESAATIKKYHTRTDIRASVLLLFGQVFIFPIVGIFISFLIHYYIKLYKLQDTCTLKGDAPPGNVTGNDPPGNVTGNDPPGNVAGNDPPGNVAGNDPPGNVAGNDPPGNVAGNDPPGNVAGNDPPGNVAGNDPPGNVAGNDPPGNVAGEDGIIQQQQQQQQQQQHQKKNTKAGVRTFSFSGTFENGILGGYITEHQNEAKILQEEKQKEDDIKAKLSVIVTLSYMFSLYSVIMSMLAVIYANNPNLQGLSEFEWYEQLEALRAIPIIIFVEDVIIFNSLHFYTTCLMIIYIIKLYIGERESKCNNWLRKYIIPTTVWKYSAYCAIAPGFNLAIHGFDIIIALIHNEVHATSVGAAYVALLLINVYTLRALYKSDLEIKFLTNIVNCLCCCCNAVAMLCCCFKHRIFPFRVFFFFLVSLFITGICGFIVAVYIILPINSAFDKASSSLRIIYSVAIFVFTAFVTYWLLKKK